MRRKTLLLGLGLVTLILGTIFVTLYIFYKQVPAFYKAAAMPEGAERLEASHQFWNGFGNLLSSTGYPDWWVIFTTDQINGFLQDDFLSSLGGDENLPEGCHDLRVRIDAGRLILGCRYGDGFWSTILSIELKMWLVANPTGQIAEMNKVALEVADLHAGALPISRQILLDYITEMARRRNIDVRWYHRDGNPVAIMKLQADQLRPTIQLERFELQQGKIIIMGRSADSGHAPAKAAN